MKFRLSYFVLLILLLNFGCNKAKIENVETTLGIKIPSGTKVSGHKSNNGQDYEQNLVLKFTDEGLADVIRQIEQTEYFNLQHDFHCCDGEWKNSDTAFYYEVRKNLQEEHRTGYWIIDSTNAYRFHEPNLSDIPNSSILFNEAFMVEARIVPGEKTMEYKYIKL